ncbi:MAG: VOC family protein [Hydrogenophaga sp.]|uniref:VOC family protein n=1 Tax=Hydrogenophaga sp. TaxID=1904254 RepID=UPI00263889C5|nr:VOC family protein [Hydrogenophaga sp.]MDM7942566.1 VOC family protein [Hydrogenophaga sp.]
MVVSKLAHFSVRTTDMESSRRFYVDVMGFKEGFRPPFNFPGLWLYIGGDESDYGVVHIIGVDTNDSSGLAEYLGERAEEALSGSGVLDHVAFSATDLQEMYRRLKAAGLPFRERTVPSLGLHQVFVEDPSGITIELNFPAGESAIAIG